VRRHTQEYLQLPPIEQSIEASLNSYSRDK